MVGARGLEPLTPIVQGQKKSLPITIAFRWVRFCRAQFVPVICSWLAFRLATRSVNGTAMELFK
jgi:hypothetical protein